DRISRLLAWPRSPKKTMSCPDRMAFSIWGMTDPSKPMMPGNSSSPDLILRIMFLRISCLTGRTRYSLCRSWARVVGCSNGYLFLECGDAVSILRGGLRLSRFQIHFVQLVRDGGRQLWEQHHERSSQTKPAGDHHGAVRDGD